MGILAYSFVRAENGIIPNELFISQVKEIDECFPVGLGRRTAIYHKYP